MLTEWIGDCICSLCRSKRSCCNAFCKEPRRSRGFAASREVTDSPLEVTAASTHFIWHGAFLEKAGLRQPTPFHQSLDGLFGGFASLLKPKVVAHRFKERDASNSGSKRGVLEGGCFVVLFQKGPLRSWGLPWLNQAGVFPKFENTSAQAFSSQSWSAL